MRSSFGHLFQKRDSIYLRVRLNGKERTMLAGTNWKSARKFQAKVHSEVVDGANWGEKAKPMTLRKWRDGLRDWFDANHAATTARVEKGTLDAVIAALGDVVLSSLTSGDVETYIGAMKRSAGTKNRHRSLISRVCDMAVERGYMKSNPVGKGMREEVKPVPYVSEPDVRKCVAAAETLSARFAAFVRFVADTGLRRGEAGSLTWPDVQLVRNVVVVGRAKGKRPRDIHLTPAARAAIESLDRGAIPLDGPHYVWPEYADRKADIATKHWERVRGAAGFPRLRLHDMRHGFCSRLAQAGVPLPTIAALAGHRSITTTMRYASHMPDGATAQAIARLGAQ